jgi:predicted TIM-barrel fold metal-dependent hydrolase
MTIDFHTHVFSPRIIRNRSQYIDQDPCFATLYSDKATKLATAEDLIKSMDEAGIDASIIVNIGWTIHELCVETNDYILESIARYPKRLIGFCTVQPRSPEAATAEIERCTRAGARGIGEIRPDAQLFSFTDEEITSHLVDVLLNYKLILLIHTSEPVGHDYPGKGTVTPDIIYPLITNYPDLTIVCAHWGGGLPFYALMPEVKQAMENVYFDTAASPLLYRPQVYNIVSQLVGADKILFGSDYPLIAQSRLYQEISVAEIPEEAKNLILSGNARRILNLQ